MSFAYEKDQLLLPASENPAWLTVIYDPGMNMVRLLSPCCVDEIHWNTNTHGYYWYCSNCKTDIPGRMFPKAAEKHNASVCALDSDLLEDYLKLWLGIEVAVTVVF